MAVSWRTVAAFAALVLIWGSAFSFIKVGLDYSPPVLFAGVRTLVGGFVLVAAASVWGGAPELKRTWPMLLVSALFNVILFIGLQTFAVEYLTSGLAAVLVYLQPILVGVMAWLWLAEPLSVPKVAGLLLGFAGVVAISAGSLNGGFSFAGILVGVLAALAWAAGTVYFKRVQARVSMLWFVAGSFMTGGVVLLLAGLAVEPWSGIEWTGAFLFSLFHTGVLGCSVAWMLWLWLVRAGEASRVSAYAFFVPLVSVILGALFLNEPVELSLLLGAACIVTGIYLVNRRPAKG
ncbi:EamA family transporter [Rubrobacter taiwanensis]|uniref:EamA family transporter n=1 Tax=Rubrobacter taiwanensis TaxID=185139 RepID=A0A4R1BNF2_9ACTN|nr:DMT family transporter [Rubrobacter taiwanensis]TCJ18908.1 EamA family transporter [Rubrobacter taiwanensis]